MRGAVFTASTMLTATDASAAQVDFIKGNVKARTEWAVDQLKKAAIKNQRK